MNEGLDLATIGVAFDSTGLEAGQRAFQATEQAANKTADAVDRSAQTFTSASTSVKSSADLMSKGFGGLTLGQVQFIEKLKEQAATMGMSRAQMLEYQAAQMGVTEQTRQLIDQIKQASKAQEGHGASMGSSLAKMEAMRVVHDAMIGAYTRMTSALFVLANASGLMNAILTPAGAVWAAVAAAVMLATVAFVKGTHEMEAMNNALAVTSNYAGMARSDMERLANSMTQTHEVTIGAANGIVTALVASGKIGGEAINTISRFVSDYARSTGQDIDKVAPKLIALFEDPMKGAVELNSTMHFLTATQMEHIAALQRTGEVQKAQDELAELASQHMPKQAENMGVVTKALHEQRDAWSKLWHAMMDAGKDDSHDPAAQAQKVRDEISELLTKGFTRDNPQVKYWQAVLDALEPAVQKQKEMTEAEKAAAAANQLQAQAWDAVKTSSAAYHAQELRDRLKLLEQFKPANAAQEAEKQDAIRKTQQEMEDAYRSMGAVDRQLYQQQQANILAIDQIRIKSAEDDLNTMLKTGQISKEQFDQRMLNNQLDANFSQQEYERAMLRVTGLSATEKQAHELKLKLLQAERDAMEDKGVNAQTVDAFTISDASTEAMNKFISSLRDEAQKLEDANKKHEENRAAVERSTIAHLDAAIAYQEQFMAQQRVNGATKDEIDQAQIILKFLEDQRGARERIANALSAADVDAANKKAAEEASRAWKQADKTIKDDLATAIVDGGGNGVKKLIHDMEVAFAKMVLRPIIDPVSAGIASIMYPGAPEANPAVASGGNSNISTAISAANTANNAYKLSTGGLFNTAGSFIAGAGNMVGSSTMSAFGAGFAGDTAAGWGYGSAAEGFANMGMTGEASAASMGSMAATGAGVLGGVAGGIYGGRMVSGGYGSNGAVNTGTAIGAAVGSIIPGIGTAIGAAVGGILGGVYNRLFGHKAPEIESQGIRGTFSGDTTTGETYQTILEKGGLFTSDKRTPQSQTLAGDLQKQLTEGFRTIQSMSSNFAKAIGADADALDNYSKSFDIKTTGDATKDQKAITDFFTTVSDEIARKLVPNIDDFTKSGESASAALQRLAGDFKATDQMAAMLGKTAVEVFGSAGVDSATARERLIDLAGGVQNLNAAAQSFAQNYLTDAEKLVPVQKAVTAAMAAMGLSGITTRDQLKQVVLGLDLTTEAGAKEYTQIMAIQDAFAQTHPVIDATANAIDNLTDAQKKLLDAVTTAHDNVQTAYDNESKALTDTITKFQDFSKSLRAFKDSLLTGDLSPLSPGDQYSTLKSQFDKTYSMALSGDPEAMGNLQGVAQQFLTASKSYNGSNDKYVTDFNRVQSALGKASSAADQQVAIAQQQLSTLQNSVNGILDLNKTVLSLKDAITQYFAARMAAINGGVPKSLIPGSGPDGSIAAINNDTAAYKDQYGGDAYYLNDANDFQAKFQAAHMVSGNLGMSDSQAMAHVFGHTMDYWANVQAQFTAGKHPTTHSDIADTTSEQSRTVIAGLYQQVLGRAPDEGGLSFWSAELDAGVPVDEIRKGMQSSAEAAHGSHASGLDRVPFDGYRAILHSGERVQTKAQADSNDEMLALLRTIATELKADKTQRGAVAQETLDRLELVASGVEKTNRTLRAKA